MVARSVALTPPLPVARRSGVVARPVALVVLAEPGAFAVLAGPLGFAVVGWLVFFATVGRPVVLAVLARPVAFAVLDARVALAVVARPVALAVLDLVRAPAVPLPAAVARPPLARPPAAPLPRRAVPFAALSAVAAGLALRIRAGRSDRGGSAGGSWGKSERTTRGRSCCTVKVETVAVARIDRAGNLTA